MTLINYIADQWITYIMGNYTITGIVILIFIISYGLTQGWSRDVYLLICLPYMLIMTLLDILFFPVAALQIVLLCIGIMAGALVWIFIRGSRE